MPVSIGPDRLSQGMPAPLLDNMAELMITAPAEFNHFALATLIGDRTGAGQPAAALRLRRQRRTEDDFGDFSHLRDPSETQQ